MKTVKVGFVGNHLVSLGVLLWVSISVGPWWIGLILFLSGMILNLLVMLVNKGKETL